MDLLDPKPGGLVFSNDLWMIDTSVVYQDLDTIQDRTLADSLAAYNLSIESSADKDTEGEQIYDITERENFIHSIPSEGKARHISPPISTDPTISDNVSVAPSTPDLCEYTPDDYILEYKEWSTSGYDSSNNSKENISLCTYL